MKIKCVACGQGTTWNESFGPASYCYCPKCFNNRVKKEGAADDFNSFRKVFTAIFEEAKKQNGKG